MNLAQANDCLAQLYVQISNIADSRPVSRPIPKHSDAVQIDQASALTKYMCTAYILLLGEETTIKLERLLTAYRKYYPENASVIDHGSFIKEALEISGADIKFPQETVH